MSGVDDNNKSNAFDRVLNLLKQDKLLDAVLLVEETFLSSHSAVKQWLENAKDRFQVEACLNLLVARLAEEGN